jgi:hypothetical protein
MRVCDNCHSSIVTGIPYGGGALGEIKANPSTSVPSPDKIHHQAGAASSSSTGAAESALSPSASLTFSRRFRSLFSQILLVLDNNPGAEAQYFRAGKKALSRMSMLLILHRHLR